MGLFSQIFGGRDAHESYRNEMQRQSNRLLHIQRISDFQEDMSEEGIDPDQDFQFECIFTTDTEEKAKRFSDELKKIGYRSNWQKPDDGDYKIFGYTQRMQTQLSILQDWTSLMCELAEAHDCEFARWLPVRPNEER